MSMEKKLDDETVGAVAGGAGFPQPLGPDDIKSFVSDFSFHNCWCCKKQSPSQCYYQTAGAEGAFYAGVDARATCPGFERS